ncbi:hypothetical protein D8S78_04780 [Natrialba swarupiae]|nr:hypothetical protein [Natrialba swarupiae]
MGVFGICLGIVPAVGRRRGIVAVGSSRRSVSSVVTDRFGTRVVDRGFDTSGERERDSGPTGGEQSASPVETCMPHVCP